VLGTRSFWETFGYSLTWRCDHRLWRAAGGADRLLGAAEAAAGCGPVIEFITLLPLVIPAIVIVFGYIRLYNTSSLAAADRDGIGHRTSC
jgi:hypothetical protein